MKIFLLFILLLANNFLHACGFYPHGEDTRISLFNPTIFGYGAYSNFYYSTDLFSSNVGSAANELVSQNNKLWFNYCHGKVNIPAINIAVYQLSANDIDEYSQNQMIQYLYRQKDFDAISYLRFAKNCEFFNSWQDDPWERNLAFSIPKRTELMNKAIEFADKVQKIELKKRYTFLAIRLAWYNQDFYKTQSLFSSVFEKATKKDILYYWSLYFKSFTEAGNAPANFELAQVFANAEDKRFVCHQYYNSEVSLEQSLHLTHTNAEKANVYLFYGIVKPDRSLPYLQRMYALNPSSNGLSFLLLREINKIEDYVFTPYYTLFQPSSSYDYWDGNGDATTSQTLRRSEQDRLYAKEVLQFINSVNLRKVENPFFWQCCKAYLQFIIRDYTGCLASIKHLEKSASDKEILNQLQIIKSLALTANQAKGSAITPTAIQSTIIANQNNKQFIFAIGKELEYLGNTTEAALLYAKLDNSLNENTAVFWKTFKNKKYASNDYFVDYFDYIDAVYTPEQIQLLINAINNNKNSQSSFAVFKYETVTDEIQRLYDLLGTKYIRQNKLDKALDVFSKIDNHYWSRTYTTWGNSYNIFDQNPFYSLKYTPKFITSNDAIRLNKFTVTKQLITYLQNAENKNEKDRDYFYFLVANAYYNMGQAGNVSMMRRIGGWSSTKFSIIEDEAEFRQSNLAKKYYLLAMQNAKTDKFKALCLRLVIRCEKNKLHYKYLEIEDNSGYDYDSLIATNHYYRELKEKFPDYFDDLVSNCDNLETYFKARR